jgi:hypothetical protein
MAMLTQQCGKCLRWCCAECYAPWTALACGACRAEARAAAADPYAVESATIRVQALKEPAPAVEFESLGDARCRERPRSRGGAGPHRHREHTDVRTLAARVADLERRLQELRPGG